MRPVLEELGGVALILDFELSLEVFAFFEQTVPPSSLFLWRATSHDLELSVVLVPVSAQPISVVQFVAFLAFQLVLRPVGALTFFAYDRDGYGCAFR